ncbi:class I SAM-dependent methyltransferase [Candidatus Thorarchaeota archaeon]|nr:MAG: class I SAM-dependent methyltransferase [Candidatus Thorarchaeota archaeon]
MKNIIFNPNVYRFLYSVDRLFPDNQVEKSVLDCGAGGKIPPLGLLHKLGFDTCGIDILDEQIEMVRRFEEEHDVDLNIQKADMTEIPFDDESFGYVYSQNSIFHLTKYDTAKAMHEMKRVLRPQGFLYVNFLSVKDEGYGEGEEVGPGEWRALEHGESTVHSYYGDGEPDQYFADTRIILREKRILDSRNHNRKMVYIEYIARKA